MSIGHSISLRNKRCNRSKKGSSNYYTKRLPIKYITIFLDSIYGMEIKAEERHKREKRTLLGHLLLFWWNTGVTLAAAISFEFSARESMKGSLWISQLLVYSIKQSGNIFIHHWAVRCERGEYDCFSKHQPIGDSKKRSVGPVRVLSWYLLDWCSSYTRISPVWVL